MTTQQMPQKPCQTDTDDAIYRLFVACVEALEHVGLLPGQDEKENQRL